MKHVKENWVNTYSFHASDENDIAKNVNELIDRIDEVIDDSQRKSDSTYSSDKTAACIQEAKMKVIDNDNDNETTTFSSRVTKEKIENGVFKLDEVDFLPDDGNKTTIYLTNITNFLDYHEGKMPLITYAGDHNNLMVDMEYFYDDALSEQFGNLSIGDVIEYKKIDENTRSFIHTNVFYDLFYERHYFEIYTGNTILNFSENISIGTTFKLGADYYCSLAAGASNPYIEYNDLYGITGFIGTYENGVYRITDIIPITDIIHQSDSRFSEKYDVFLVTFEEVGGDVPADYTVDALSSVFLKRKQMQEMPYSVLSEIDRDSLVGTVDYDIRNKEYTLQVTGDGLSTLTLEGGKKYRLKDRYLLTGKNVGGNNMFQTCMSLYGVEALAYEEVSDDTPTDYDNIGLMPGAIALYGHSYGERIKGWFPIIERDGDLQIAGIYKSYNIPSELKIGDVLKVTENNEHIPVLDPILQQADQSMLRGLQINKGKYIAKASTNVSVTLKSEDAANSESTTRIRVKTRKITLNGVINWQEWEKDGLYRLTEVRRLDSRQLFGVFQYSEDMTMEGFALVFEKEEGDVEPDYNVDGLPGVMLSIVGRSITKDKWMYIDGDWECLTQQRVYRLLELLG